MADPRNAKIAPQPRQHSVRYFTDWALAQLDEYVGATGQPLTVTTTIDLGVQKAADEEIDRLTPPGAQGKLVSISTACAGRAMGGGPGRGSVRGSRGPVGEIP